MRTIIHAAIFAALLVGGVAAMLDAGQKTGPGAPPLATESMYGPDLCRSFTRSIRPTPA